MAINRTVPLSERVAAIHAEIEALIESHVAAEAKACPNVPAVNIRQMIKNRTGECLCAQYSLVNQADDAAA